MLHDLTQDQFTKILDPDPKQRMKNSVEILTGLQKTAFEYALREGQPSANDEHVFPPRKMQEAIADGYHTLGAMTGEELAERLARIAQAHTFTR